MIKVIQHCLLYIQGFKILAFVETPINSMDAKIKGQGEERENYAKIKAERNIIHNMNEPILASQLQELSQGMHLKEHVFLQSGNQSLYHNKRLRKKIPLSYMV